MVALSPRIVVVSLLLAAICPIRAAEDFISVEGKRVSIMLVPEKPEVMLGEPAAVLLILHNYSDTGLQVMEGGDYRNRLGRQDSFKVSVLDAFGRPVPQPDAGQGMGGIFGPRDIPVGGSYSFRLFLPHWAQLTAPGAYTMTVRKQLSFLRHKAQGGALDDFIKVDVVAATTFSVVLANQDKTGELIDTIGAALLKERDDQWPDGPATRLAAINDERVIPWYAKAFASRSYDLKFSALTGLAKFNHTEAFTVLKQGMDVKGADLDRVTTPELAEQLAANIRHAAAAALSQSPYPGAMAFLISRRSDSSTGVRTTILHVLGKMPPAEALPILEEMAQDQDTRVSNEAKRYIGLLRAKK